MATHNNPLFSAALGILVLCLGVAFKSLRSAAKLRKIMPPGPPGLPFLGNLFQLPQFQWLRFTEWKAQYGPIISLNLGGQPVVVLNSYQVASDLLDNRSAIYSDRPRFIMGSEILTGSMLIAFMTYGDPWKKLRRAAHDGLTRQVSASYTPIQEREASILVKSMIGQPSLWDQNLRRKAFFCNKSSPIDRLLGIVYGLPPLCRGRVSCRNFSCHEKVTIVDGEWKKEGLEWHRKDTILFQGIMNDAKDLASLPADEILYICSAPEILSPCFAGHLIENPRDLTEKESAWRAGSETVAAALCVFILAMTLYPNVMRTAQAELDQGGCDRANLPYIEAIVKEVLRWRPVGPLGKIIDDWYNGYFILKYAYRDPEIFPDYDEFRPERYLEQPDLEYVTYGFGRRRPMMPLFINIASMLSALDFAAPIDDSGNKILPSRTACVDKGLVVRPVPFECCITPRQFPVSTSSKE
ncbi:cytochrome P450 [Mycena olivaceomarginata]|nr:cytochrome P450 [Mycena olivaceomarginata]